MKLDTLQSHENKKKVYYGLWLSQNSLEKLMQNYSAKIPVCGVFLHRHPRDR